MDTMLVHLVTVPFTIAVGFFLGWMARNAAGKRADRVARSRRPLDQAGR
jgi:hypothetical protein